MRPHWPHFGGLALHLHLIANQAWRVREAETQNIAQLVLTGTLLPFIASQSLAFDNGHIREIGPCCGPCDMGLWTAITETILLRCLNGAVSEHSKASVMALQRWGLILERTD
jgi:hypothetical protein